MLAELSHNRSWKELLQGSGTSGSLSNRGTFMLSLLFSFMHVWRGVQDLIGDSTLSQPALSHFTVTRKGQKPETKPLDWPINLKEEAEEEETASASSAFTKKRNRSSGFWFLLLSCKTVLDLKWEENLASETLLMVDISAGFGGKQQPFLSFFCKQNAKFFWTLLVVPSSVSSQFSSERPVIYSLLCYEIQEVWYERIIAAVCLDQRVFDCTVDTLMIHDFYQMFLSFVLWAQRKASTHLFVTKVNKDRSFRISLFKIWTVSKENPSFLQWNEPISSKNPDLIQICASCDKLRIWNTSCCTCDNFYSSAIQSNTCTQIYSFCMRK